jgi:hypothetical protein
MKHLLFRAFVRSPLAPPPRLSQSPHPLIKFDRAANAKVLYVSNDTFAQATNLVDPSEPHFDPRAFGPMGKVMDSWESVRHNPLPFDYVELELTAPSQLVFAELSTKWHDGNQAPSVGLEARVAPSDPWTLLLPPSPLLAHGMHRFVLNANDAKFRFVRVCMYPDGGLTRLRLYDSSLPKELHSTFPFAGRFPDAIPAVEKATSLYVDHSAHFIAPATALRMLAEAASNSSCPAKELNVAVGGSILEGFDCFFVFYFFKFVVSHKSFQSALWPRFRNFGCWSSSRHARWVRNSPLSRSRLVGLCGCEAGCRRASRESGFGLLFLHQQLA